MKKKRGFVAGSVILTLTILLSACSGNQAGNPPSDNAKNNGAGSTAPASETGTQPKEVTITAQYAKPDNPVAMAVIDDRIERFKALYPHVTVEKNDWQYAPQEIGIKMAAKQAPSFFNAFATEGNTLVGRGWAADLTSFMAKYQHAKDLNPTLTSAFEFDGKQYALPDSAYIFMVMINKKLFEAKHVPLPTPDWTWDDLYEAAKATADPGKGIAGFASMAKGPEGGWNWTNFLYQAGGEAQKVEGGKVVSAFQSEAGVKAMEFLKKLRWEANVLPENWALNYGDTYNLFKQGRAAIVLGDSGRIEDAVNNGGMNKDDLLLLPMPAMEAGGEHLGVLGGNYVIINPQEAPEVQQAAFDFVTMDLFSDSGIAAVRKDLEARKAEGKIKAPPVAEYFDPNSEFGKKMQALYAEYPETVYVTDPDVVARTKGKPEPAYNAQDYYAVITNVMQEVFINQDADVKALLESAAKKFDADVLSKVVVE